MKYTELTRSIDRASKKAQRKRSEARAIHNKIRHLRKELRRLRSDRAKGIVRQRFVPREVFTKERRIHDIHDEIERNTHQENALVREAESLERMVTSLNSFAGSLHGSDHEDFSQVERYLSRIR